jgi:hypothetical protein
MNAPEAAPLSKLEAMKQGIMSPNAMSKLWKNNKTDVMMAGAGLLPLAGGLGSLGQKGSTVPPYLTGSTYTPVSSTQRYMNPNAKYNAPGSAEQNYFLNNSRGTAVYGAGGGVDLDFQAGGPLPTGPQDTTQRSVDVTGAIHGFAEGGSPMLVNPGVTALLNQPNNYTPPQPFTHDNSGF